MTCSSGGSSTVGDYYKGYKTSLYWLMELAGAIAGIGLSILLYFVLAHFGFPNTGQVAVGGAIAGLLGYLAGRPNKLYSKFCPHPAGGVSVFLAEALGIAWNALFVLALTLLHMFNNETAEFTIITGFMAALFGYIIGRRIGSDSYKYCGGYMHASGAGEGWDTPSEDRYMMEMLESVRSWRPYVERWGT